MALTPEQERQMVAQFKQIEADKTKNSVNAGLGISGITNPNMSLTQRAQYVMGGSPQGQALSQSAQFGLADTTRGEYNLIPRIASMLHLSQPYTPKTQQQFGDANIRSPELQAAYPKTSGVGQFGGEMIATAPYSALGTTARGAMSLPKFLAKATAKNAALTGALAPIVQPDASIGKSEANTFSNPLTLAALGAGPALTGGKAGLDQLRKLISEKGGVATPEEVTRTMQAAGETKVPLGNAIDSVPLKGLQSTVLPYVPFSGMAEAQQMAGKSLSNRLDDVLKNLKPSDTETTSTASKIKSGLIDTYKQNRKDNKALYTNFAKSADDAGIRANTDNYKNVAQNRLNQISENETENPELANLTSEKDLKPFLQDILKTDTKSFKGSALATAKLNEAISGAKDKGDAYQIGMFNELKRALDQDIETSATNSGHPEIQQKFIDAKQHYANNVAPFEEDELYPYISGKKGSDTLLQTFVKTGQWDRPELLNKIVSKVSDPERKAIAHEYLTKSLRDVGGNTKVDADKVLTAYSRLGDRSKDTLFNADEKQKLDDILHTRSLFGKDTHISDLISNPTGQKAAIQHILAGLTGAGATAIGALGLGHHPEAAGTALATLIGGPMAARMATHYLMSNAAKSKYIAAVLRNAARKPATRSSALPVSMAAAYQGTQNPGGQ